MQNAQFGQPREGVTSVWEAGTEARAEFIKKTYSHLFGALLAFVFLEILYFQTGIAENIARAMMGVSWLIVLAAFLIVGFFAGRLATKTESVGAQYVGLFLTVGIWSIMFVPLLYIADRYAPGVIGSAAMVSLVGFSGLTAIVFMTRKDFSFLRGIVMWGFGLALLFIIASVIFGFTLGTGFAVIMVGLCGASILYDTSNVLHHYPENMYVGAALQLFTSVALLFYYVLILFMNAQE